ncbi:DUF222 domain-containing protein, partial [Candidatus Binatia bacterium]|nr:DUF222 domain-containing protein [Candidatus Binatia bacterium]
PRIDDALRRGAVSYAKTRALTRVATAANEATLLEMARHATASQLERICRGYRKVRAAEAAEQRPESLADEELRRFVRCNDTDDGMVRVEARLRPEEAAALMQALEVARRMAWRSPRSSDDAVTGVRGVRDSGTRDRAVVNDVASDVSAEISRRHPALSRADALVVVAEAFLASAAARDHAAAHTAPGALPVELVVHVDAAALREDTDEDVAGRSTSTGGADEHRHHRPPHDPIEHHATLADGSALSIATAQRLACDAAVVTVTHDAAGNVTHTSRRTRRISTTLRNLCSLCRRHHRLVHEHGYRIEAGVGGELRFFRRDGAAVPVADERRASFDAARDAVSIIRNAHARCGLAIDASTAFPRWDGAPVDYGLAVQAVIDAR